MKQILIAYIPVLHEGYRRLFTSHSDAQALYIFGPEIISEFDYLAKEIRALDPKLIRQAVQSWQLFTKVAVLKPGDLRKFNDHGINIVMPDEDVTRSLAEKYLPQANIQYDQIFLRWDKHNTLLEKPLAPDQEVSVARFDQLLMRKLTAQAKKSSDWWRQVGAAVVKNNKIILIDYNRHVPSPHIPYANSDPRNSFHKGDHIELSTALHAEAALITRAAQKGMALKGTSIYVSTFPCPVCAKLIAYSGAAKLYYSGGYGVLDGEHVLKANRVKIIFVDQSDRS